MDGAPKRTKTVDSGWPPGGIFEIGGKNLELRVEILGARLATEGEGCLVEPGVDGIDLARKNFLDLLEG